MKAVAHSLRLYIEDFELKLNGLPSINADASALQLEALNKEMRKLKQKLDKLFDDYEDGLYTANEFVERKAKHTGRLEEIQKQIDALETVIPEQEEYQEKIVRLTDALTALEDDTIDAETKNAFLKAIIDTIEFSRENREEFVLEVYIK